MRLFLLSTACFLVACSDKDSDVAAASDAGEPQSVEELTPAEAPPARSTALSLSPLWVAEGFEQPEGVALDPEGNYFISNIGSGGGADKDGDGYISVVYQEGEIAIERWAEGLDAPKGMQVHDGTLYVADVDKIRRFDMYSGAAFDPISVVGAELLEDVTVWQEQIYVSDSRTSRIYRLTDDTAEVWKEDPALQGVNGLLGDGDRMLIATMATGTLYAASFDGTLSSIADGMIDADGIGVTSDGSYLVSSRPGEIYTVSEEGEVSSLLNTRVNGISQNDLTVFGNTVIVPNWQANTVSAWRITR